MLFIVHFLVLNHQTTGPKNTNSIIYECRIFSKNISVKVNFKENVLFGIFLLLPKLCDISDLVFCLKL